MYNQLQDINNAISYDVRGFLEHCDTEYETQIEKVAEQILNNSDKSTVVFLSGPSASGKTTTAMKIEHALECHGILSHTISMDNYFKTLSHDTAPRTETGDIDFESPSYLDATLLAEHFESIEQGRPIHIPKFNFSQQSRVENGGYPLHLKKHEIAIFEGIHALNDNVTGSHQESMGVYVAPVSDILDGEKVIFPTTWMRLTRRIVRDYQFRGTNAETTMQMWPTVGRGERLYISPFAGRANITIDSAFPYEASAFKKRAQPLFQTILQNETIEAEYITDIVDAFSSFAHIDQTLIHPDALLREFLGGGSYEYK